MPALSPSLPPAASPLRDFNVFSNQHADPAPIDVSVCIANWNCRDLLRRCLASLLHRDQGVRVEVIVVDNASSDGAPAKTAREFPEVKLIRNETNRGFARANNQAARYARGRFLFFLNNDTVVPPDTLGKLLQYLEANPDISIVGPLLRDGQGRVQMSHRQRPTVGAWLHRTRLLRWTGLFRRAHRRYRRQRVETTEPQTVEVLLGAAMFMLRDRFRAMGGWDEDFHFGGEDLEFCLRAARHGKIVYLQGVEITHLGRVSTKQHIAFACTKIHVGFAQYLRKSGCGFWGRFFYKLAITLDTPLQLLVKGMQYLMRRLLGQKREAKESLTVLRGLWPFMLRGWWAFWRA
jgi:N-acetylglucosaminyl-diphospho-decaprenol L-rhamnosyltransferase